MQELPDTGQVWTCPRCGDEVSEFPASSRTSRGDEGDAIYICSACGSDETFIHEAGGELPQPHEWPVDRRFGAGGEPIETARR